MTAKNSYAYISSNTTTQVKGGNGVLKAIIFGKPVASSTVTIYDAAGSDTTPTLALITNTTEVKPYALYFDVKFSTGLKIVTSGSDFITVVYQ